MNSNDRMPFVVVAVSLTGCLSFYGFFQDFFAGLPDVAAANTGFWWITAGFLASAAAVLLTERRGVGSVIADMLAIILTSVLAVSIVETIPFAVYRATLGVEFAAVASVMIAVAILLLFLGAALRTSPSLLVLGALTFAYVYLVAGLIQSSAFSVVQLGMVPVWTVILSAVSAEVLRRRGWLPR